MLDKTINPTLQIDRKTLIGTLQHLKKVRTAKSSLTDNMLKMGQAIVRDNLTYLAAYNLEQYLEIPIAGTPAFTDPQTVCYEFEIDRALNFVKSNKSDVITIKFKNGEIAFSDEKTAIRFTHREKGDDWEPPKFAEFDVNVTLPVNDFAKSIAEVFKSVSHEEARYYLNGIYFELEKSQLNLIATNGHHLTRRVIELGDHRAQSGRIVPNAAIKYFISLAKKKSGNVCIGIADGRVVFEFDDGTVLFTRDFNGSYPDYRRVIPKTSKVKMRFDKSEMIDTVKLFSNITKNVEYKAIKNTMRLWSDHENAITECDLDVDRIKNQELCYGAFNAEYLNALTPSCNGDKILWQFNDHGENINPAIIRGNRENHPDDLIVLLPMKTIQNF